MGENTSITPQRNALDSLTRVAHELERRKDDAGNPMRLKAVIAWSWHAVGLLAYLRLKPGRQVFDTWVQDYLHEGKPALDIERDAHWEERERLSFLELLDIMSSVDLPSLKPEFYQGWQDRMSRCRWLRQQTQEITGFSLRENQRQPLLLLLAVYHRLIRLPAGVDLDPDKIIGALPIMFDFIELLIDKDWPEEERLNETLKRCRRAI